MTKSIEESSNKVALKQWEIKSLRSERDLTIKKTALAVIAALNLAALGVVGTYIVLYCPFPAEAYVGTPFLIGVLGALIYLGMPTFGVNRYTYKDYTNPVVLAGKVLTHAFFGPYVVALKRFDFTNYHDRYVAHGISRELSEESLEKVATKYGRHVRNLTKYGFLNKEAALKLRKLVKNYKNEKRAYDFLVKEKGGKAVISDEKKKLKKLEGKWEKLQGNLKDHLPFPETPAPNFAKKKTKLWYLWRKYFKVASGTQVLDTMTRTNAP